MIQILKRFFKYQIFKLFYSKGFVIFAERSKKNVYIFEEKEFSMGGKFSFTKKIGLDKKGIDRFILHRNSISLLFKNSELKVLDLGNINFTNYKFPDFGKSYL